MGQFEPMIFTVSVLGGTMSIGTGTRDPGTEKGATSWGWGARACAQSFLFQIKEL